MNITRFNANNGLESFHFMLIEKHFNQELGIEDIQYLLLFEYQNYQKQRKLVLALSYNDCQIYNGRVLGLIAFAAIGFFLLPGLVGVSPLMGLLIGASLGWKVLGFSNNRKQLSSNNQRRESVVSSPGFDTAPQPPQIGGVIPLIFTNKEVNLNGGVRINGNVLNAYVKTIKNEQILYTLTALGLGEYSQINSNGLLIDNQPLDNFFVGEITSDYTLGTALQTRFAEFPFYSQCVSPSNNSNIGISFKALVNENSLNGNTFTTSEVDFDAFNPSEKFSINGFNFRVINKVRSNLQIFTNSNIPNLGDRKVYALYELSYETTKRCTRLDLNFAFDVWARNTENNLVQSAIAFSLYLNDIFIGNFYESNSKEGTIRRALTLENLFLKKHKINCYPLISLPNNQAFYRLDDSGSLRTISTGIFQDTKEIKLTIESNLTNQGDLSSINSALLLNKAQHSSDRGANGKLTSINEIVYPSDIGQSAMTNYPYLAIAKNVAKASNRLSASPAYSHEVNKGIKGRNHLAAGLASIGSSNALLIANGIDLSETFIGAICRNLTRQIESIVTSISGFNISTQNQLNWTQGDEFLVFFEDSINYFPDIFVYTLLSKKGGLGNVVSEKFINYPSICESRKFCKLNQLFWDGILESPLGWDEWVNQESLASLLYPSKYAGNYGLKPEQYTTPTDIFNVSRIFPGTFSQAKPDNKLINAVQLTYRANIDSRKFDKTITVMTDAAYFGREAFEPITLNYPSITNESQAKKVAARTLKSRIIQNKVITFKVGICGFSLKEGDLIIVQYALTEKESEISGFCLVANTLLNGSQEIKLSRKLTKGYDASYKANIYHLESGFIETDKTFQALPNGNLLISGLSESIKPAREKFNADIIIICRNVNEKIFRVASIKPSNYEVEVNAINWSEDILNDDNLFYVT